MAQVHSKELHSKLNIGKLTQIYVLKLLVSLLIRIFKRKHGLCVVYVGGLHRGTDISFLPCFLLIIALHFSIFTHKCAHLVILYQTEIKGKNSDSNHPRVR